MPLGGCPLNIFCSCGTPLRANQPSVYSGTSLIRNRHPVGPYNRTMPRLLWRSWRRRRFLMSEVPLYHAGNQPCIITTRKPGVGHEKLHTPPLNYRFNCKHISNNSSISASAGGGLPRAGARARNLRDRGARQSLVLYTEPNSTKNQTPPRTELFRAPNSTQVHRCIRFCVTLTTTLFLQALVGAYLTPALRLVTYVIVENQTLPRARSNLVL